MVCLFVVVLFGYAVGDIYSTNAMKIANNCTVIITPRCDRAKTFCADLENCLLNCGHFG